MRLVVAYAIRKEHCNDCDISIQQDCLKDPVCASMMWIDEAPTIDAVEVVRCKDCKSFWQYSDEYKQKVEGTDEDCYDGDCYVGIMNNGYDQFNARKFNDFCSDGERK